MRRSEAASIALVKSIRNAMQSDDHQWANLGLLLDISSILKARNRSNALLGFKAETSALKSEVELALLGLFWNFQDSPTVNGLETVVQTRRHPCDVVLQRIESLIEREYLERSQDDHRVYNYVA